MFQAPRVIMFEASNVGPRMVVESVFKVHKMPLHLLDTFLTPFDLPQT